MSFFFLMCSERSGSNFIIKLLNGHKEICGPSTKHIINPVSRNLYRYGDLNVEKNWECLLEDIYNLLNVSFSVWKKEFTFNELKEIAPSGDIKSLISNIFLEEARANGKEHLFIKENQPYEFMSFLLLNFPEAKYIYQTRDPRDMALSWKKNHNHPGGVIRAAKQWQKDQQQNSKNFYELKKINRAFFIRYEDLISSPEAHLKEIISFFGLSYDKNILNFHKDELTQKNASMQKAWNNLSKGIIKDNKNKYIAELNQEEILAIEKICYFEMLHLGYKLENTKEEIENFSDINLENLEEFENQNIKRVLGKGVQENIDAKRRFYQKNLS